MCCFWLLLFCVVKVWVCVGCYGLISVWVVLVMRLCS